MTDAEILNYVPEDKKTSASEILRGNTAAGLPFIIKALLGFGAVVSSCLFFAALGSIFYIARNAAFFLAVGIVSMTAAVLFKNFVLPKTGPLLSFFLAQCCLVAILFGRACFFTAAADWIRDDINGFLILSFFLAVVPYKFFDSFVDRFLAVLVFAALIYVKYFMTVLHARNFCQMDFEGLALIFFMISGVIFAARKKLFNPVAWALVVSMLIPVAVTVLPATSDLFGCAGAGGSYMDALFNWQKEFLMVYFGIFFLVYKKITSEIKEPRDYAIFIVLFFALLPFNLPVIYGLFFLLLGRFFADRKIEGLGYGVLCGGIIYLYYGMNISLLNKSLLLMASGAVLLSVRFLLKRFKYAR